VGDSDARNM